MGIKRFGIACLGVVIAICAVSAGPDQSAESRLYTLKAGEAWVDFGSRWNSWSQSERSAYLDGIVDGGSRVYLASARMQLSPRNSETLRRTMAVVYDNATLRAVVTDLYRDPANTYIENSAMVFIARDKLDGKDVEPLLREARVRERAVYKTGN